MALRKKFRSIPSKRKRVHITQETRAYKFYFNHNYDQSDGSSYDDIDRRPQSRSKRFLDVKEGHTMHGPSCFIAMQPRWIARPDFAKNITRARSTSMEVHGTEAKDVVMDSWFLQPSGAVSVSSERCRHT
jgi:hypothetical protein